MPKTVITVRDKVHEKQARRLGAEYDPSTETAYVPKAKWQDPATSVPPEGMPVLIVTKGWDFVVAYWDRDQWLDVDAESDGFTMPESVTGWMYLPMPPDYRERREKDPIIAMALH